MSPTEDLFYGFEIHSPAKIRACLDRGVNATNPIDGKAPIEHLIEMYTRSAKFAECLRVMLEAGAVIEDSLRKAVLLDDTDTLRALVSAEPSEVSRRIDMVGAYTSCRGVTALHLCAEFNSVACAKVLLDAGADLDSRAAVDADGFGGHTPIFHTVNSNGNYCRPMLELLVDRGASLDVRLKGLRWGEGFDWETLLFDVTVFSYAQCGLYKQFHRDEQEIYSNLAYMYERRYGSVAPVRNVPNKYLSS